MRFKHVWTYVPLPTYLKTFWERITFTRLTIIYLTFSILHFLVQLALQIRAFTINANAFQVGYNLLQQGNAISDGLPFYSNSKLYICKWVPSNLDLDGGGCRVVWPIDSKQSPAYYQFPSSAASPSASNLSPIIPFTSILAPDGVSATPTPAAATSATTSQLVASSVVSASSPDVIQPTPSPGSSQTSSLTLKQTPSGPAITITVAPPLPTTSPSVTVVTQSPPPLISTEINNGSAGGSGDDDESNNNGGVRSGGDDDDGESDDDDNDDDGGVPVAGLLGVLRRGYSSTTLSANDRIDPVCLDALSYPLSILGNTKREDIVFMAFQFWVLGMSVVAVLNESIPHIFASLLTHIMATAWGGFQLVHTAGFRSDFNVLITKGACEGVATGLPINPSYWDFRRVAEISSLTLNVLALLVSCFLSWRLFKLFGWQTFKRVGASLIVNRMYKLVLILSITIQLSLFFMAVTVSLWLDRLINNVIGDLADLRKLYMASCIVTLVLLVPWLMSGWFGVRREVRVLMLIFLVLCFAYLGGWSVMFVSTTFRWTFITWSFFSMIATISVVLTVTCLILGLLCRMNFGRGLLRYLHGQEVLPGGDFGIITPDVPSLRNDNEKVEFPSVEKPMPTFNVAYGYNYVAQGQVFISNGPRFFNQSPQPNMGGVMIPPQMLTRTPSDGSTHSYSSDKSSSSWDSHKGQSKRWIIE